MRSFGLAALFLMLAAGSGQTQTRLTLAPQIGFYIPTEKLETVATTGNAAEIEAGPSFGARLGILFGKHLGLDFSGHYVPTTYKLDTGNQVQKQDAKLFLGSGQLVLFLIPSTSPLTLYLNGGVGVVSQGGVAFTNASKKTNLSGVFGAGAGVRLGPISLVAGADLYTYNAEYDAGAQTSGKLKQNDIQLKLGLGIPFGG